jgi:DNA-binding transcriptional MerR regulator
MRAMRYTMPDLIEYSGLAPRTIRQYIKLGIIPRPEGSGGGALYTPHHLELLIAISRMRAQGISLAVCAEELTRWSEPRLRRYIADSEPKPDPVPPPPPAAETKPKPAPKLPPETEPQPLPPKRGSKLQKNAPGGGLALPEAPAYKFIPILPNLILCLGDRATPLVQRVAAEIYEKYAASGREEE